MMEIFDLIFVKLQAHIFAILIFILKKYVEQGKAVAVNQATIARIDKNVDKLIENSAAQTRRIDNIKLA